MADFKYPVDPATSLLTYLYDGQAVRGIMDGANKTVCEMHPDARVTQRITRGKIGNLDVKCEKQIYSDFPVIELTAYFKNNDTTDSGILSMIRPIDTVLTGKGTPRLWHSNGDTRRPDGYHHTIDEITSEGMTIAPCDDGCSCNGAWPYMRVYFDDCTYTLAIGWTSTWEAVFTRTEDGVAFSAGQKYCNFRVRPGETMRTPRVLLMRTEGNSHDDAVNHWRAFYRAHIMPKQWGRDLEPKVCVHVHAYHGPEFFGATEDSQIEGMKRYVKMGLNPDVWWFDAGKIPINCAPWPPCGHFYADPVRFPGGTMAPIGRECEKNNIDFMLWFESERSTVGSEIERDHPEFLLTPKTPNSVEGINSLINLGDEKARNWLIERLDMMIKKFHVHIYRQDFNFDPFNCFREFEEEDRLGAVENLHIQGYYKFWDELLLRNPGLIIDSCASGGRRNDLETMRRSVPFQYTDVGVGEHEIKQLQHQFMFEWIPFFRAHTYDWKNEGRLDEFGFLNAFAPAITFTPQAWLKDEQIAVGQKMVPIWREAAKIMLCGNVYRQMESTQSLTDFYCIHFYDDKAGKGFVLFIRNRECETESFTANLHLENGCKYRVEEPINGTSCEMDASELQTMTATLDKRQGKLVFFTRI